MNKIQEMRSQRFSQLIGLELKSTFVKKEVTQSSVADSLGHSRGGFSKWINAKPSMPIEVIINVCEFLSIDPRNIFDNAYAQLLNELGSPQPSRFDVSQLSEDARKEMALKNLAEHDMGIAALEDKNKNALIDRGEIDEP